MFLCVFVSLVLVRGFIFACGESSRVFSLQIGLHLLGAEFLLFDERVDFIVREIHYLV